MYYIRTLALAVLTPSILLAMGSQQNTSEAPASPDIVYWRNMLNNDPRNALQNVINTEIDWRHTSQSCDTISAHEIRSPIFLLEECVGACTLCRKNAPRFRTAFETHVVNDLGNCITDTEKPIQYVTFGAGNLFQDCVTITKFLTEHPSAQIDIHAIDPKYAPYVAALQRMRGTDDRRVAEPNMTLTQYMTEYVIKNEPQASGAQRTHIHTDQYTKQIRFQQFIRFLERAFANARVSLSLHASVDAYTQYIKDNKDLYPHVVAAADINKSDGSPIKVTLQYLKLCCISEQYNPNCVNVLLSKRDDGTGALMQFTSMPHAYEKAMSVPQSLCGISRVWGREYSIQ